VMYAGLKKSDVVYLAVTRCMDDLYRCA